MPKPVAVGIVFEERAIDSLQEISDNYNDTKQIVEDVQTYMSHNIRRCKKTELIHKDFDLEEGIKIVFSVVNANTVSVHRFYKEG